MVIGYELRVGRLQGTLLRLSAFLLLASLLLKGSLAEADSSSEAGELLGKGWQGAGRPKGGGEETEMSLGLWDSRVVWPFCPLLCPLLEFGLWSPLSWTVFFDD